VFNEDLSPAVLCDQLIHAFDEVCNRARCCHCGIDDGVGSLCHSTIVSG
jgi:hypothetical protein